MGTRIPRASTVRGTSNNACCNVYTRRCEMQIAMLLARCLLTLVALSCLAGCGESRPTEQPAAAPTVATSHGVEPAHGHNALHGGHIIELGSGKYHAELTHDDATHKVGIYVLDATVVQAAPIDAESIFINCLVSGRPTQFKLSAAPQLDDPPGMASHFELVSEALCDAWDTPARGTAQRAHRRQALYGRCRGTRSCGGTQPQPRGRRCPGVAQGSRRT